MHISSSIEHSKQIHPALHNEECIKFLFLSDETQLRKFVCMGTWRFIDIATVTTKYVLPFAFQFRTFFMMQLDDFRKMWPTQLLDLLLTSFSAGSWFANYLIWLLPRISDQCRQPFINVCTYLMAAKLVLQVSDPWNKIVMTFESKLVTLVLTDSYYYYCYSLAAWNVRIIFSMSHHLAFLFWPDKQSVIASYATLL